MKFIFKLVITATLALCVYTATTLLFSPAAFLVSGTSMFPNLANGDSCITYNSLLLEPTEIHRGDVVAFDNGLRDLVKRVVGIPGDRVEIRSGLLIINGETEDTSRLVFYNTAGSVDVTLGADEFFVLGDNRPDSHDSRSFGAISRAVIIGKVFIKWHNPTKI